MHQIISVLNTDSVNLYGSRFTVGALYLGLYEESICGVPILVAHDASRLIGWSRPLALFIEPGLTRLTGIGELAETEDEHNKLRNLFVHRLQADLDAFNAEIDILRAKLKFATLGQEKVIHNECIALIEPSLALRACPELFTFQDKDGLIPVNKLNPIGPGVYQIGEFTVFAHSYLRRNLYPLNTLNFPLLQNLQVLNSDTVRIALDSDTVGLASTYSGGREELAYWWGPKFDDDLRSIPLGVTHHESTETDRIMSGISSTQFRWGMIDNYHVFEAEELRDVPTASSKDERYGCRYAHSMVCEDTGQIEHLDGSIRMYSVDAMLERLNADIAHAGRHTEYTKLWRVDGFIPIHLWKTLLSDYFRDNFLVGEYLGAVPLDKKIWSKEEKPKDLFATDKYVPASMVPEIGIRLAITIQQKSESADSPVRCVKPLDVISDGCSSEPYVETFTLELKKALSRNGENLVIPEGTRYVSFKDYYVNLPLIYHPIDRTEHSLQLSLNAFLLLVKALLAKEKKWVLSFNIAFPLEEDREARISMLGHASALAQWLENPLSCPPVTSYGLHNWSEKVADFLTKTFPENVDNPKIFDILMPSGILLINRERIKSKDFQVKYSDEKRGFEFKLAFNDDDQAQVDELLSHNIQPSLGWLIEKTECTRCGLAYETCSCSKLLDQDVAQHILKALPFPFWTDRPL
jgi:hypothetical protein